jgi:hypothetical protein
VTANRYLERLAELTMVVGADLQPGQDVLVFVWDPQQADIARAVAEAAYAHGARYVSVVYWDGAVKASRLRHAPEGSLSFVPDWFRRTLTEAIERRAAAVSIFGDPDPGIFADVDPRRVGLDQMPFLPETMDLITSRQATGPASPVQTQAGQAGSSGNRTSRGSGRSWRRSSGSTPRIPSRRGAPTSASSKLERLPSTAGASMPCASKGRGRT